MKTLHCLLVLFLFHAGAANATEPLRHEDEGIQADQFRSDTRGIFLHGTYVLDTYGKAVPIQIDFQWAGIRTFSDYKYLLTFDAAGGLTAGYGGNAYPTFYFFGGNLRGQGEFGLRLNPENDYSLYLGGTALLNTWAAARTGIGLNEYDTVNSLDGLAGFNGIGALRLNAGLSGVTLPSALSHRYLLITAFLEESARRPGSPASGPLFTSVGVRAQFDLVKSFNATLEASWGTTFGRLEPIFGVTNTATRFEVVASVRKMLGPVWISIDGQFHGTTNTATSTSTPNVYVTATPIFISAGATFGVSL